VSLILVQAYCYFTNVIYAQEGATWQSDKWFIIVGLVSCILLFFLYMIYQ
jgi:hypothetical protein